MGMMIVVAEQIEKIVVDLVGYLLQGNHRLAKYSNRI